MRVFITGISGLLGINAAHVWSAEHEVSGCFHAHPVDLPGVRVHAVDLTEPQAIAHLLEDARPELVLHTAGLTNVDACEEQPALARQLNVDVASRVARAAAAVGAQLVHISTDHLFSGVRPLWTEDDPPEPVNVYAETKRQAERLTLEAAPNALIVRTNFYGWGTPTRTSFSDWILAGLETGRGVDMFRDIFFTPLLVNDLVEAVMRLVVRGARGILHVAGGQRLTKRDFGITLAAVFGHPTDLIRSISVADVPLKARRPRDMSLDSSRAATILGRPLPDAETGLLRLRRLRDEGWPERIARSFPARAGARDVPR